MTQCAVSLGGNLGNVPATFAEAQRILPGLVEATQLRSSRIYRTTPMGADAGDPFLNAAWVFETCLPAEEVLAALQQVENACGRVRTVHWGPRSLDLDLIFYGNGIIDSPPRLVVPHPGCWFRRFVLDPLAEVIPEFVHPVLEQSVREMRERLLVRPLPVSLWGGRPEWQAELQSAISAEFPDIAWIDESAAQGRTASVRFAFPEAAQGKIPRTVVLPDELPAAIQAVRNILTAALDAPVVMNFA